MPIPRPGPGRAALVTGASSGLGVELARGLAGRGHDLVLTARRRDRLAAVADELAGRYGVRVEPVPCDVARAEERAELIAAVEALGLEIDVLVNNAGVASAGRFQELDPERQVQVAQVNVEALVALCARYVRPMADRRRGAILNVSSTTAFQPLPRNATYAASKAFVLSFTEALSSDLAGTAVTLTALCPGLMKTELMEGAGVGSITEERAGLGWMDPATVAEQGLRGLDADKRVVVPGTFNRLGALGGQHAPRSVLLRLAPLLMPEPDAAD